jgi:hypothetical protein
MALLWVDGFEGYGDSDNERVESVLARRYTVASLHEVKNDGRYGGWSMQPEFFNCTFQTPALTTDDTLIVCFALKWPYFVINAGSICAMYSGVTEGMKFGCRPDGSIIIWRGGTILETTEPSVLKYRRWHWIEFKVVTSDTIGSYELKVDGTTVASASGMDTQPGLSAYHDIVQLNGVAISTVKTPRFDDLFIMDGTGGSYDDFIGQRRTQVIVPDGDTATVNWTVSGGSNHWELVDDLDPDDDANYVEDTVSTDQDRWTYSDITDFDGGSIDAVSLITDVRVTDANTYDLTTVVKSGGTEYTVNAGTISSTSYVMLDRLMVVDPDTSSAWTYNNVNAIEMGVEVG